MASCVLVESCQYRVHSFVPATTQMRKTSSLLSVQTSVSILLIMYSSSHSPALVCVQETDAAKAKLKAFLIDFIYHLTRFFQFYIHVIWSFQNVEVL